MLIHNYNEKYTLIWKNSLFIECSRNGNEWRKRSFKGDCQFAKKRGGEIWTHY